MAALVPELISKLLCMHVWKHDGQQFKRVAPKKYELRDRDKCTKCPKTRLQIIKPATGDK